MRPEPSPSNFERGERKRLGRPLALQVQEVAGRMVGPIASVALVLGKRRVSGGIRIAVVVARRAEADRNNREKCEIRETRQTSFRTHQAVNSTQRIGSSRRTQTRNSVVAESGELIKRSLGPTNADSTIWQDLAIVWQKLATLWQKFAIALNGSDNLEGCRCDTAWRTY